MTIPPDILAKLSAAVEHARPEVDVLYARVSDDVPEQSLSIGHVAVHLVHHPVETTPDWRTIRGDPMPAERVGWVLDRLPKARGRLLDVGCGVGTLAAALVRDGWAVEAFDVNLDNMCAARWQGVNASCCSAAEWDWTRRYDVILAVAVLEHLPIEQHYLIPRIRQAAGRLCVIADCETVSSLHTRPDLRGLLGEPVEDCRAEPWPEPYRWMVWAVQTSFA